MAQLIDPYGRILEYLRVSVTDKCNLRCFYCRPSEGCKPREVRQQLSRRQVVRVVAAGVAAGIRKVRLTGGEPLMRNDITELVRDIAAISGIADISLTTNGTLLAELAKPLAAAGLKRVNVSLDSLDSVNFAEITCGGKLQGTLEGIEAAFSAGLVPVKLNMVVLKDLNDNEIENFARLTLDRNLIVRFIEYVPMFGQKDNWRRHYLPNKEIMARCSKIAPMETLPDEDLTGPSKGYRFAGAAGRLGFITPISQHFCSRCNRLRLTSDGKLRPCLFSAEEVDLIPALAGSEEDLTWYFREAAMRKPEHADASPALQGTSCGPRAMMEIGG